MRRIRMTTWKISTTSRTRLLKSQTIDCIARKRPSRMVTWIACDQHNTFNCEIAPQSHFLSFQLLSALCLDMIVFNTLLALLTADILELPTLQFHILYPKSLLIFLHDPRLQFTFQLRVHDLTSTYFETAIATSLVSTSSYLWSGERVG
jgi:hypothetical protein